jgi:Tn3 transposase DDE domain
MVGAAARCRVEHIEPPGCLDRVVAAARAAATSALCARTVSRLPAEVAERLERLGRGVADPTGEEDQRVLLTELKADPARLGLETFLGEVTKLERLGAVGMPTDVLGGVSDRVVEAWRARAATEYPSDLADHPREVRLTLLAALCHCRRAEITDGLVDLLIALVHKVKTRAEHRVEKELVADLRRVRDKQQILVRLAEAALAYPDETVRVVLYPVVGEQTRRDVVREADGDETRFRARVRTVLRASYSNHYRRMLPRLLEALEFCSNNTAHCPIVDALDLLRRYARRAGSTRFYAAGEVVPFDGVGPAEWRDAVIDEGGRVERIAYELCVLRSLRDALRRREIWVVGASRWRDPEADLPADFELNRELHYSALRQPLDPTKFVEGLRRRIRRGLDHLHEAVRVGAARGVSFGTRAGEPWISVPRLDPLPEPTQLGLIKGEVGRRWGTVELLDVLAEADHLVGFTREFTSVAPRQSLSDETLRRRLLLVLFALGTNTGIIRMAGRDTGETEAALRHVRRLYINEDKLRRTIVRLVNATFAARDWGLWGTGTARFRSQDEVTRAPRPDGTP